MAGDVQVVLGAGDASHAGSASDFVEVLVTATGETTSVPRDWLDSPLGAPFEKTVAQKVADGEVEAAQVAEPPTERDKVEVIDDFAANAGIDLGEAKTKAEKVAAIEAALAASSPVSAAVPTAPSNPDVQLVFGEASDAPLRMTTDQAGTEPSTETPATGDEEN
jgi:hypothetical protein